MNQEEILEIWREEIEKDFQQLHRRVQERRELVKKEIRKVVIWLGGPGPNNTLFPLRGLVGEILKKEDFEVVLSEDFLGGADLASKEIEEVEALDMVVILSITTGASAEAIEFAYIPAIRSKLWIYFPEEYKDGYVFRSLFGKHRLIGEDSLFSLEKSKQYDPELALKIVRRAISYRNDLYRRQKMK